MRPVSPYGCTKLFGFSITKNYRVAYDLFAANGILFNHESPKRGSNFVTSKIIKTAIQIKLGLQVWLRSINNSANNYLPSSFQKNSIFLTQNTYKKFNITFY